MTASIGMVMVVTPHTLISKQLSEENNACCCKCSENKKNENESAELSSTSKAASLLQVLGDRILLALNSLLEGANPLNVSLGKVVALTDSLGLVCETVTKVSVLNESGKNLVTVGSKSCVVESVDVLGNAVGCYTKLLTAELIKLEEVIQELFINFSAHDYKPHLKNIF